MSLRQKLLDFLMDPNIAFLVLSLGMLALWAEFNNPGAIVPGVVGVICVLVALFALNLLPTRFAALTLILLACCFSLYLGLRDEWRSMQAQAAELADAEAEGETQEA